MFLLKSFPGERPQRIFLKCLIPFEIKFLSLVLSKLLISKISSKINLLLAKESKLICAKDAKQH